MSVGNFSTGFQNDLKLFRKDNMHEKSSENTLVVQISLPWTWTTLYLMNVIPEAFSERLYTVVQYLEGDNARCNSVKIWFFLHAVFYSAYDGVPWRIGSSSRKVAKGTWWRNRKFSWSRASAQSRIEKMPEKEPWKIVINFSKNATQIVN